MCVWVGVLVIKGVIVHVGELGTGVAVGAVGEVGLLLPGQPMIKKVTPMRSEKIPALRSFIEFLKILV